MSRKIFAKELRDYLSIFAFFILLFATFEGNMSFAAYTCANKDDLVDHAQLNHCRDIEFTIPTPSGQKVLDQSSNTQSFMVDFDGNLPVTCGDVDLNYNPYTSDDYYYESKNKWCLGWSLGISITYATASVVAGGLCTYGGAAVNTMISKMSKITKLKKLFQMVKSGLGNSTTSVAANTAASVLTDPVIALQIEFGIDALVMGGILAANLVTCAGEVGMGPHCVAAAACGAALGTLTALSQSLIWISTAVIFDDAQSQINKVHICGDDWSGYAYTANDMNSTPNRMEWYPQYGSFSNSYSYKLEKAMSGEYSCKGYLKDENVCTGCLGESEYSASSGLYGGSVTQSPLEANLKSEVTGCLAKESACKSEINSCIKQRLSNGLEANIGNCLTGTSSCSAYCKGYFAKCEPMLSVLDGDGICQNWNSSTYKSLRDSAKEKFSCKGTSATQRNNRNRVYRERLYKGKEFKVAVDYTDSSDCIDPRLDEQKGYTGLEQRYYFRGRDAAQYACNRFIYKNKGCRLPDGTIITKNEAAQDEDKNAQCEQAFKDAENCCQMRRGLGVCLYNSSGIKADRDNSTMCMRSLTDKSPPACSLNTGTGTPKFLAYTSESSSLNICVRNINYCPFAYNVAGGTELEEVYCGGDFNCDNCVAESGHEDDLWNGIKYRNGSGKIKDEYKYVVPLCSDKDKIWKKSKYKYPTMAYGQTKNFCQYNRHCTEVGESDYDFVDMTSNKYLPQVCSDFIGDSQNLPYPVKVADLSLSGSVTKILKRVGYVPITGTLTEMLSFIDGLNKVKLVEVYGHILSEQAIITIATSLLGAVTAGPAAAIIIGASGGVLYTASNIKDAVENDGNARETLKTLVTNMITKPLIDDIEFSLGDYRGFTAPIAQCIKETLSNMFYNKAGRSKCKNPKETLNSEGLCGTDTFGPPKIIKDKENRYYYMIGDDLPASENIFYKIQSRLQLIIKIVAALAIFVIGLRFLMKGDLDIFSDVKKPRALIVGMLKFAIVFYFAVGNAWQSQFYSWIDKGTQYLYYKAFDLSLVGYSNYKNEASKKVCTIQTITEVCSYKEKSDYSCKNFEYTGAVQTLTLPASTTTVTLEVWGAQGGDARNSASTTQYCNGGKGGYSYGTYTASNIGALYIYVGGAGGNWTSGVGGWNGGVGKNTVSAPNDGAGGGATDVRTVSGAWNNAASLASRIIVAGGGGGASEGINSFEHGGYGGGGNSNGGNGTMNNNGTPGQGGGTAYCLKLGSSGTTLSGGGYYGGGAAVCGTSDQFAKSCDSSITQASGVCGGGGGGSGYITGLTKSGGSNGVRSGNGAAIVCYNEFENVCEPTTETLINQTITDSTVLNAINSSPNETTCINDSDSSTNKKCYTGCADVPSYDGEGNVIYEYSDTYDGCYFGNNVYPEGKQYLAIFDSLDCKLMNYFNYGPEVSLPGILHMLLISLFFSPLAVAIVILGFMLFVILLSVVIRVLYIFIMSMIAINIMIYVSPIIFPTLLFEKYKGIFEQWLNNMIGFCLQLIFVIIFAGLMIGGLEIFSIGSARFVNHDPTTGRLPMVICENSADSILCIFKINTAKGTTLLLGDKIGKFLGLGPVVSVVDSITKDFFGVVMTLLKFCIIMYVLLNFAKKIPFVASELVGGKPLMGGDLDVKATMEKIADTTSTVARGAKSGLKKGASALGNLKGKGGGAKDEKRPDAANTGKSSGAGSQLSGVEVRPKDAASSGGESKPKGDAGASTE